ncbi:MAG: tetratricopeptide repeat protein [Candidatus Thorarchaeota archaeon]
MGSEEQSQTEEKGRVEESERWQVWLDAARLSKKNGKLHEAEAGYRLVIELNPRSIEGFTELCALLLQQRRETEAEIIGKQLIKLTGGKGLSWSRLRGQLREKYIDREAAVKIEEQSKEPSKVHKEDKIDKREPSMSYPSQQAHTMHEKQPFPEWKKMGSPELMADKRPSSTRTSPEPRKPKSQRPQSQQPPRQKEKSASLADTSGRTSTEWLEFAQLYSKQGKYPDAERALRSALTLDSANKAALLLLAEVLYKREKFEEAVDIFDEVIVFDPRNARNHYLLGMCHMSLNNYWEASQAFYKCVALNERFIDAWAELGIALSKQGRHAQAQKAFLRALKERRSNPRLLSFYGLSLLEEGKLDRAENVLRMAIGANPDFAPAWEQLSRVLTLEGKHELANQAKLKARTIASRTQSSVLLE